MWYNHLKVNALLIPIKGDKMNINIDKERLLNDMANANGEGSLTLKPYNEETWGEYEKCTFAFFPGCRLGASEPEFILRTYDTLLAAHPDTAIILQCCGFLAELTDEINLRDEALDNINAKWNSLGKPKVITACNTCRKILNENLPFIPTVSLAEHLGDPIAEQLANFILSNDDMSPTEKEHNRAELKSALCDIFL